MTRNDYLLLALFITMNMPMLWQAYICIGLGI